MDRSFLSLPDPMAGAPNGERRRRVRQKLHTPVYASFNGPQTGMVVDLSELLDLHEDGFAVQTSQRLEMSRAVTLCLDLPETRSFIHGSGQVIWSDDAGRGGIRFSALPDSSRRTLKEWLLTNLLIACSNHAARAEQLARRKEKEKDEESASPAPVVLTEAVTNAANVVPISEGTGTPSSVEAVRNQVREIGDDVDAVFQLITERALSLTGASGAALAFLTDGKIICRARAGEPAPPLGAPLDVKHGLSGECVRDGLLVSCEDMQNDPRVDPEIGHTLGIGSLMATPIMSDFRVVGLLEIFSPNARGFTKAHGTILDRLVEMIPKTHPGKAPPENSAPEQTQPETPIEPEAASAALQPSSSASGSTDSIELVSIQAPREALWEQEPELSDPVSQPAEGQIVSEQLPEEVSEVPERASAIPYRLFQLGLLGLAIVVVAVAIGYLFGPIVEKRWADNPQASQRPSVKPALTVSGQSAAGQSMSDQHSADQRGQARSLADLRKLADHGDAEAQWQMGVRYHSGEDVPQDDVQAVQWFERAAEQGNVAAQGALGAYYWRGRGVPEDLSKAYFWSAIALAGGDQDSKVRLEGLALRMTRAQVYAARQQAEVWIRSHYQNPRAKSEAN
jgi:hypothetical protein